MPVEGWHGQVETRRGAKRARIRKKALPSTAGLLLKIGVAVAAIGLGVPLKIGLSAMLGAPLANAVFCLWVLVCVRWIGINGWRWLQR